MLAHSFFIKSSSKLLVTRTGIKAWSSLILGWIRPLILELLALEWRKFHTFELEYLWSHLVNLDQILCVAALGWGKGCIRFWGRLDHSGERTLPFGLLVFFSVGLVIVELCPFFNIFRLSHCKLWNFVNKIPREPFELGSWYDAHRLCPRCRWPD